MRVNIARRTFSSALISMRANQASNSARGAGREIAGVEGIVKRRALVVQHDVVRARHAHDVVASGRAQQGQQRVHVVLIGFRVIGVADVAAHRQAHSLPQK